MLSLRQQAQRQWHQDGHPGWKLVPANTDLAALMPLKFADGPSPPVRVSWVCFMLLLHASSYPEALDCTLLLAATSTILASEAV